MFGSFSWNENGTRFIYVAEEKIEEMKDHLKFVEVENFGERLQNVKEPVICYFDLITNIIKVLDIEYEEDCAGKGKVKKYPAQPVFIDDDNIVFMGIDVGSKKLGMVYIYCRPTSIYKLNLFKSYACKLIKVKS